VGLAPTGKAPPCHGARGEQTFVRSVKADSPDGFGNVEIVVSGTFMTSVPRWLVGILEQFVLNIFCRYAEHPQDRIVFA
jgi:hypothetical protein